MAHRTIEKAIQDNVLIEKYVLENEVNYNTAIIKLLENGKISKIKRQSHHESYSIYKKNKEIRTRKANNYNREKSQNYKVVERALCKKYKGVLKVEIFWLYSKEEKEGAAARVLILKNNQKIFLRTETDKELFTKIEEIYKKETSKSEVEEFLQKK